MPESAEKQAAIARLLELEHDLVSALNRLEDWRARDLQRDGGSTRQDVSYERNGREYEEAVSKLRGQIEALKVQISAMD